MTKKPETIIRYFRWEGDACRLHTDADGNITADLYRAGMNTVPIDPTDLLYAAVEINEAMYRELVLEEVRLGNKAGANG